MPFASNGVYYPPRGGFGNSYGAYTPQEQTMPFNIPGAPMFVNMMGSIAMRSMFKENVFPGMRTTEHFLGQRYREQMAQATSFGASIRNDVSEQELAAKLQRGGMTVAASMQMAQFVQSKGMGATAELAEAFGMNPLLDAIAGPLGITQGLVGRGVFRGMRHMRGAPLIPGGESGRMAYEIAGNLTPEALGMNQLGATQVGGIVSALGQRGLLPGRMDTMGDASSKKSTIDRMKRQVKGYGEMIKGLEDLFGAGKPIDQLFKELDQMTQGGLSQMGAGQLTSMVNQVRGLQYKYGIPASQITTMMAYGGQAARQLGLVPSMGSQMTLESIGVAAEIQQSQGQFFGARNFDEIQSMVNRDMLMGQKSAVALRGGGLLAAISMRGANMGMTGSLSSIAKQLGGSASLLSLVSQLESGNGDPATLAALRGNNMPALVRMLGSAGVNSALATNMMTQDSRYSQEMRSKFLTLPMLMMQQEDMFQGMAGAGAAVTAALKGPRAAMRGNRVGQQIMRDIAAISDISPEGKKQSLAAITARLEAEGVENASGVASNVYNAFMHDMETMGGGRERLLTRGVLQRRKMFEEQIGALLGAESDILKQSGTLGSSIVEVLMAGDEGSSAAKRLFGAKGYARYKSVFDATEALGTALNAGDPTKITAARANLKKELANKDVRQGLEQRQEDKQAADKAEAKKVAKEEQYIKPLPLPVVIRKDGEEKQSTAAAESTTASRTETTEIRKDSNGGQIVGEASSATSSRTTGRGGHVFATEALADNSMTN